MKSAKCLIHNARIVGPDSITEGDLALKNGVITHVGDVPSAARRGGRVIEARGLYALPGFIDIHFHGGQGLDATLGVYQSAAGAFDPSPRAFAAGIPRLLRSLVETGVTSALLTTLAAPDSAMAASLPRLGAYVRGARNGRDGARLLGLFMEGTFIKNPSYAGAQNPDYFKIPSVAAFNALNRLARGAFKYVNVVPEYGAPALKLIEYLRANGVLVGAGHTSCPADRFLRAVAHGLSVAVHFTNGPTGTSFKPFHGGNVVEAVLGSRQIYAEIIADGCHVNPAYALDIIARKGCDRVILVTDAMFVAGMKGVSEFTVSGLRGFVSEDRRSLRAAKKDLLFGSILRMDAAVSNALSWMTRRHPGVWREVHEALPLTKALLRAAKMASSNPAAALGVYQPAPPKTSMADCCGSLEPGKRADVILAAVSGKPGKYVLRVRQALVSGRPML